MDAAPALLLLQAAQPPSRTKKARTNWCHAMHPLVTPIPSSRTFFCVYRSSVRASCVLCCFVCCLVGSSRLALRVCRLLLFFGAAAI